MAGPEKAQTSQLLTWAVAADPCLQVDEEAVLRSRNDFRATIQRAALMLLTLAVTSPAAPSPEPAGVGQQNTPATEPATVPATQLATPRVAIVTAVVGRARARAGQDEPWEVLREGTELMEGAEIQTDPKAKVQLTVSPEGTVILIDRAVSRAVLAQLFVENGIPTTKVILPAGGKVKSSVPAGIRSNFQIVSPSNALGVRGTEIVLFDQPPFTPQAVSLTGRGVYTDAKKRIAFGSKNGGRSNVRADQQSAADAALQQSVVDPSIARARTAAENQLIRDLLAHGATTFFDPIRGIEVVRGGTVPPISQLMSTLPGLNIVLSWPGNTNLDLSVNVQNRGEFLYPIGGLNRYPSGANVPFDHRGGGGGGFEVASFPTFASGDSQTFFLGANFQEGQTTRGTFRAFLDGALLPVTSADLSMSAEAIETPDLFEGQGGIALLAVGSDAFPFGLRASAPVRASKREPALARATADKRFTGPRRHTGLGVHPGPSAVRGGPSVAKRR